MHIPDGYLSPGTCASLYAAAAPFWYVGMKRARAKLATQAVPLLAVFSAFSFVLMMFNLPLPGGTTGHAVGMGMASIVLGPWMSILAISVALFVQAFFFGDGGILSYGANCFNMAIAGSLVAYGVYRLGSLGASLSSMRRVLAAGLAGYAGINVAALLAAVEFGVQPLFFRDVNGTPLYAPYPLSVSIPAMMIGHLTFAGFAEFLISAGMVKYLGRVDPALLLIAARDSSGSGSEAVRIPRAFGLRKLWIVLAIAMCLTPLGIVAVGKAWGEWNADDFASPAGRKAMAAASDGAAAPSRVPPGLANLSRFWRAPLADYELAFLRNSSAAYFLCASLGIGVVIAFATLITSIGRKGSLRHAPIRATRSQPPRVRRNFLEKTVDGLLVSMQEALVAEEIARSDGFLQAIDPRVKLLSILSLVVASVAVHRLTILFAFFSLGVLLAAFSRISPLFLLKRIWMPVLAFTGLLALPALFTVPGDALGRLPVIGWNFTFTGLMSAALLIARAEAASTFSLLLVLCTPWNQMLRALRSFRVPATAIVILQMTHRYVFLLVEMAHNMLEARRARLVGYLDGREQRHLMAATGGVLLDKTFHLGREVHSAMQARGFRGSVYLLEDHQICARDRVFLAGFFVLAVLLVWLGR
ncbi:MAG: cobalt transporter CbiM [Bryobacteraceae bacterium]